MEKMQMSKFRLRGYKCECGFYMEVFGGVKKLPQCCVCKCELKKPEFDLLITSVKTTEPYAPGLWCSHEYEDAV